MTDKCNLPHKKHNYGKRNIKSKFTNGFRNIFHHHHHQKPMTRSSSVPTQLDDVPVVGRDGVYPQRDGSYPQRDGSYPQRDGVYPYTQNINVDIDISSNEKTALSKNTAIRSNARPTSAYFGSVYDIDISQNGRPMGGHYGSTQDVHLSPNIPNGRPISAMYSSSSQDIHLSPIKRPVSASYGSHQDINLNSKGKPYDSHQDNSKLLTKNQSHRKSWTSLDYFKKDLFRKDGRPADLSKLTKAKSTDLSKAKPADLLKAKHKITIYDSVLTHNNHDVILGNSPTLVRQKAVQISPDTNNNTQPKFEQVPPRCGSPDIPAIPSSLGSVKDKKEIVGSKSHISDGHEDANTGIKKTLEIRRKHGAPTVLVDSLSNGEKEESKNGKIHTTNLDDKSTKSSSNSEVLNSVYNSSFTSPRLQSENSVSSISSNDGDFPLTSLPKYSRSLTESQRDKKNNLDPTSIPRSNSADLMTKKSTRKGGDTDNNSNMGFTIEKEKLQTLVKDIIQLQLADKRYDGKFVTRWCKDICVKVRDRLLRVKELRHKIVVNAHIASKAPNGSTEDTIFVSTRCQKDVLNDRFITVALEGIDLYVWVTVLLIKYR